jgi:hypothetical protein
MKDISKVFAFYFPQFYPIPQNDHHWGKGFTDWDNVKSITPQFHNHQQPKVPLMGYYDQSEPSTIKKQVDLANAYGLDGFSFYHYWFDGELVLEKPVQNFLDNKDLDLSFTLTWANETWSKRWIGEDNVIIFKQTHSKNKAIWEKHFLYLLNFWKDKRYYKIAGKPVFNIYNPHLIKNTKEMFAFWEELALTHGLPGIHFVAILVSPSSQTLDLDLYNGILDFQPRYSTNAVNQDKSKVSYLIDYLRFLPESILNPLTKIRNKFSTVEKVNYVDIWDDILSLKFTNSTLDEKKRFYGAFVDWDNTPRYKSKGKVYIGGGAKVFGEYLMKLIRQADSDSIIYINAWNEWSEGAMLEPDTINQYEYLEAIKNVVKKK